METAARGAVSGAAISAESGAASGSGKCAADEEDSESGAASG